MSYAGGSLNQLKPTREQIITHYMEKYKAAEYSSYAKRDIAVEMMETLIQLEGVNERGKTS